MELLNDFLSASMIVKTGGGLQPYWLLSEPLRPKRRSRCSTVGITRGSSAGERGWHCDAVFDLPRILRLPGTYNCKEFSIKEIESPAARPVTLVEGHLNNYSALARPVTKERPKVPVTVPVAPYEGPERAGDHFNRIHHIDDVLGLLGFHSPESDHEGVHWVRPGKPNRRYVRHGVPRRSRQGHDLVQQLQCDVALRSGKQALRRLWSSGWGQVRRRLHPGS